MRGLPRNASLVAGCAAVALVATACGGGGSSPGTSTNTANAAITIDLSEPQNGLIPGNTNETGGGRVVRALWTGLVQYAPENAAPSNAMAESIDTKDSKTFTIKIKKGWKFHDGTEVKAKNYVDAWNWVAYSPNAALNAYFFEQVQGFTDVNTPDPDGPGPKKAPTPKAKTMSGLKVVDDHTFTVTLSTPFAVFPVKLGYDAYDPLPDSFFKDPKAFGEKPIGNGPFKFVKWDHKQQIVLTRNDAYSGPDKAKVKDVTLKIYQSQDAAYADLRSDNLDFQQQVPTSALAGDRWKTDLGNRYIYRPIGTIQTVSFPLYDKRFQNPNLRKAISMAIDRKTITDKIFNKARIPATSWVSPAVDGYKPGTCGLYCTYDPAKAKAMLAQAGGFTGQLTLGYNADGDHKPWTEATCNSISNALGIACVAKPYVDFATFRNAITSHKMTGMFRTGWQMDYPSIENFLNPLYRTNASSNDGLYSSAEFDNAVKKADAATNPKQAVTLYQAAEAVLAKDMPTIPLWNYTADAGYSNKVKNVRVNAFGELELTSIEAK